MSPAAGTRSAGAPWQPFTFGFLDSKSAAAVNMSQNGGSAIGLQGGTGAAMATNKRLTRSFLRVIEVIGWSVVIYLAYVAAYDAVMRTYFSLMVLTSNVPAEIAGHPFQARYVEHPWLTLLHTIPGFFFMILGPLQFMSLIRRRWIRLHRLSGRIYLGACALVALGAISMGLAFPMWGWTINQWAVLGYSLILLFFVYKAYRHIRAHRVAQHREWMIRGFATGLAIATFRIILDDVLLPLGLEFTTAWNIVVHISFPINLAVAEFWIWATRPGQLPAIEPPPDLAVHTQIPT